MDTVNRFGITYFNRIKAPVRRLRKPESPSKEEEEKKSQSESDIDDSDEGEHLLKKQQQKTDILKGVKELIIELPDLARDITMLGSNEEIAFLTPLHLAIMGNHTGIIQYIVSQMKVDLRIALSAEITDENFESDMMRLFPIEFQEDKLLFEENFTSLQQLSEEQ